MIQAFRLVSGTLYFLNCQNRAQKKFGKINSKTFDRT